MRSAASPAATGVTLKVVIVDDSVSVCQAIERMLRPRGAAVVSIHSGREALARLEGERPDLIFCDLVLPDLAGLEVCRFVRRSRVLRGVPLVVISGVAGETARRQALAAGADAVLHKPFHPDALSAHVDALLQPALRVLGEIARLPGLVVGCWRLANGRGGTLGTEAVPPGTGAAPDPEAVVARLWSFPALGDGAPTLLILEGRAGEVLFVGHRERRVLCLRLTGGAALGRTRRLANEFLGAPEGQAPATNLDRKEPRPWKA